MSRIFLKLRIWNKNNEEWVYETVESICQAIYFNDTSALNVPNSSTGDDLPEIFCLFTGLPDKNGKEIYFDDWVKARYETVGGFDTMEGIIRMSPAYQLEVWSEHKGEGIALCNCHSIEIIGNIHSNPISKKKKGKYVKK